MANYIQTLQASVKAKDAEIAALRENLRDLRLYLTTSAKFGHGRPTVDRDGLPLALAEPTERLDWISTSEAVMQIDAIVRAADAIRDEA